MKSGVKKALIILGIAIATVIVLNVFKSENAEPKYEIQNQTKIVE